MTFTEIVTLVASRAGVKNQQGLADIEAFVNLRYKAVASSIGLPGIQRTTATATTTAGSQELMFGPTPVSVEKILAVYDATTTPPNPLGERTVDTIRTGILVSSKATLYANNYKTTDKSVTVLLNCASSTPYTLTADVLANLMNLSGLQTPAFAESFHDILMWGALADVYDDKDKAAQASKYEKKFDARVSELRYHVAKSGYLQIAQGLRQSTRQIVPVVQ